MAQREQYRTNGAAAYDVFADSTARQLVRRTLLPEEPRRKTKKAKALPQRRVSLLRVTGVALTLGLLLLSVFSFVSLYEAQSRTAELEDTYAALAEEQKELTALYEQGIDLDRIAARAEKLGLHRATGDEIVTVHVPGGDSTEVFEQAEEPGFFAQIGEIFRGVFRNVAEYFS